MEFSRNQIERAVALKKAGLPWRPRQGQYIYDLYQKIEPGSPFQNGIYFLHDFDCFVDYFGSVEKLAEACVWIPTFEESRELVVTRLSAESFREAIARSAELDFLYDQLITELQNSQ